ncbi:MAG: methanogenesis marker 7 protein [Candidatus Methanomethyliaceae archaeon]|nr:methanogenesis marker 7 protein [Candidatus Methanomethyliaceae archaeon]
MLKYLIFEGGVHKHEILVEFVEDLGGFIIQKNVIGLDLIMHIAVPENDLKKVMEIAEELKGSLKEAPLIGVEIVVVAPSLSRHHLPHPACDIAENLRRHGAKTNLLGLSRGVGQKIAHISKEDRELIEEHDIAIFVLGNFEYCLKNFKTKLFKDISIPIIVTGGPDEIELPGIEGYVGGIGRYPERFRINEMIEKLELVSDLAERVAKKRRREMDLDPLIVEPALVKKEIERQMPEALEALSPSPITLKIDGLRIKLPYDDYRYKVASIDIEGRRLGDIANIKKSLMRSYILVKILPQSYLIKV